MMIDHLKGAHFTDHNPFWARDRKLFFLVLVAVRVCNDQLRAKSQLLFANCQLLPYGCPTTTIDSGLPPVGEVDIKAVVALAAVIFAFKTATVLDPLLAT